LSRAKEREIFADALYQCRCAEKALFCVVDRDLPERIAEVEYECFDVDVAITGCGCCRQET
jgi:hypothetical protein